MGDVSDIKLIMKELTTRLQVELKDVKDKSRKELDEVKQRHTADIEQLVQNQRTEVEELIEELMDFALSQKAEKRYVTIKIFLLMTIISNL